LTRRTRTLSDEPIRPKRIEPEGEAHYYGFKAAHSLGPLIDRYAADNGHSTRSAAIRDILERALEVKQ